MKNIRYDAISGVIDDIGRTQTTIQFSEWWGKEGLDFVLYTPMGDETKTLSLSRDELHALVVASICSGYVDAQGAINDAESMKEESKKYEEEQEQNNFRMGMPNPLTLQGDLTELTKDI